MSRIFLSHASPDNRQAIALKQWLSEQNPRLTNEIFLDLDPKSGIRTGERWQTALRRAIFRAEAVMCLLTAEWEARPECLTEYRTAENLNKRVFGVRLEPDTGTKTSAWQWCDLFGGAAQTAIDIGDGLPPVQFGTAGLYRLRDDIRGAGIGADTFVWPGDDSHRAPYRGWQPFEPADAGIFFGRDTQILRALEAVRGMRKTKLQQWFVILGPSGAGKSSFLRAGLLPRLQRDDQEFLVLGIVRPERDVLDGAEGFARAIHSTFIRLGLAAPPLGDVRAACVVGPDQIRVWLSALQDAARDQLLDRGLTVAAPTLVLPIDQAEELLAPEGARATTAFLRLIHDLQLPTDDDGIDLIVAATIRSDRFEGLQTRPELTDIEFDLYGGLKPMPSAQFERVIVGPAERATEVVRPLAIDPDLVEKLLDDCKEGSDTLPLLSLTLWRLYEDYGESQRLTLQHYERIGGLRRVVQSMIDGIFAGEGAVETQLASARSAFIPWLAAINPDNDQPMRRVARWSELPEDSRPIVDEFVSKRLLVKDQRNDTIVVEVALESLLRQWDELTSWLDDQRHELKATEDLERATAHWEASGRNDTWLLVGSRLTSAEALFDLPGFKERVSDCRSFVDASRRREHEQSGGGPGSPRGVSGLPTLRDKARLRLAHDVTAVIDIDEDAVSLVDALRGRERSLVAVLAGPSRATLLRQVRGPRVVSIVAALSRPDSFTDSPIRWRAVRRLYLLSADAATNLRRLDFIGETLEAAKVRPRLPVLVRIDDPWQAASCRARFLGGKDPRWAVDAVSKYEVTAAQLLDRLEVFGTRHLYLCGGSTLTLALCAESGRRRIEREYFANAESTPPPVITLVGHNAQEYFDDVERRERETAAAPSVDWLSAHPEAPTVATLSRLLADSGHEPSEGAVVFVDDPGAAPDDTLGSRFVSRFPTVPVFVWTPEASDATDARAVLGELHTYGLSMRSTGEAADALERAVMLIHARYVESARFASPATNPWTELDEFHREAQRRLVRNVLWVVENVGGHTWDTFGHDVIPLPPDIGHLPPLDRLAALGFDHDAAIAMVRVEHEDWLQYYRSHGWTYAPMRDEARKRHNALIAWEDVANDAQRLDAATAAMSSALLSLRELGYRSRPVEPPP